MDKIQQIIPISEMKLNQAEVLSMLGAGPVVLANRSRPAAVLVSIAEWDRVADELAQRRFTQREVEAIVAARLADLHNEPTIAHDDLVQMIMARRASEYTTRAGNAAN